MSSIEGIARAKIEAHAAGEEYVSPETAEPEVTEPEAAEPETPETEPAVEEPEPAEEPEPTEEEQEAAATEAADEAEAALPDTATQEERAAARAQATDDFYAGTYKTREEAEKGIAEKDATLQRLFSEKNTLEQRLQQIESERDEEPEEIDLPAWDAWAQQQVEAGAGAAGAEQALEKGGYDGYQVYLSHWLISEDPRERAAATLYNNEVVMQIAEVRAQAAADRARETPTAADEKLQAAALVVERNPDFNDYHEQMTAAIADMPEADVTFLKQLAQTGVEGQARALEMLYLRAKSAAPAPSTKKKAEEIERGRRKASADAATLAATSPTSEGTTTRTPPPAAEAEGLRRKSGLRERQNLKPLDE